MTAPPSAAPAPASLTLYARGPFQAGGLVILDPEEAHHVRVRRLAEQETVRLVDGRGGIATARLSRDGDVLVAHLLATTLAPAPPVTELLLGAGDRDRFLDVVERATELGATRIVPVLTERSLAVATRFQAVHVEKALRRSREAVKQCGAAWAPAVAPPAPLAEALRPPFRGARYVADPAGGPLPPPREPDAVQWAVGPEGGFTESEQAALAAAGFRRVRLARSTLRFDTAALAALALVAHARLGATHGGQGGHA